MLADGSALSLIEARVIRQAARVRGVAIRRGNVGRYRLGIDLGGGGVEFSLPDELTEEHSG